ncbi:MAG: hypothetical protein GX597_01775 [Anaerolineaceae bacterium]|nr:hypothetical protein [Anaerolineaceae bacterium]
MKRSSLLALVVAGLLTEGIYLAITLRLPWWTYGGELQRWSELMGNGWSDLVACLAGLAVLLAAYALGWGAVRKGGVPRKVIWAFGGLYAITLFWLLPITADLFVYLGRAHLFTDLEGNPLEDTLVSRRDALLAAYPTAYARHSSAYGPAWSLISAPGTMGRHDVAGGLAYLKGLAVAAYAGMAWLLERILRRIRPGDALQGLYLFAWNPLVLVMGVGDGHNDMVMIALVLLAFWLLLETRWLLAFLVLWLSAWIKYMGAAFVPFFLIYAGERWEKLGRQTWPLLLGAGLTGLTVTGLVFAPFRDGGDLELLALMRRVLIPVNAPHEARDVVAWATVGGLILLAMAYLWLLKRLQRSERSYQDVCNVGFVTLLLAFVLGAARSQPWHLIWPVSLAGLSDRRWAWPVVIVLSAVMLVTQLWVEWGAPGLGG